MVKEQSMNREEREQIAEEVEQAKREAHQLRSSEPLERWRREMGELEAARAAAKGELDGVHRLYASTKALHGELAEGLRAVSELAGKVVDRLDDLEDELGKLRKRVDIAEVRHEDLKRSHDLRGATEAEVIDLPNPLARRK
jgi:chromosome segregation ATPase